MPGVRTGRDLFQDHGSILGTIFSSRCQISRACRTLMRYELMSPLMRAAANCCFGRALSIDRLRQGYGGQPSFSHRLASRSCGAAKAGGARRDRTDDLLLAKQALSQLSYGPVVRFGRLANRSSRKVPRLRFQATPGNHRSLSRA
jgi:hypothetical protein